MRVLHLLTDNDRRGAQSFGALLHSELDGRGVDSRITALRQGSGDRLLDTPLLGPALFGPGSARRLRKAAQDVDVVVAHGSRTLLVSAIVASPVTPFVYVNIGDPAYWASTWSRRVRVRKMLARAAAVAPISPRSKSVLRDQFGVPEQKMTVIPNGRRVPQEHAADSDAGCRRTAARHQLGLPVQGPVVLVLGAVAPVKRVDLAVQVVAAVPEAHLLVAGAGSDIRSVQALADRILPGRASFVGLVEDVTPLLAAADVLLMTSASEGLPGALVEAGMAGVPAVVTDVGFVSDVVQDGVTGRVVPSAEVADLAAAVQDALLHGSLYGAAARERCARTYAIEGVADKWEALLAQVVEGRHAR